MPLLGTSWWEPVENVASASGSQPAATVVVNPMANSNAIWQRGRKGGFALSSLKRCVRSPPTRQPLRKCLTYFNDEQAGAGGTPVRRAARLPSRTVASEPRQKPFVICAHRPSRRPPPPPPFPPKSVGGTARVLLIPSSRSTCVYPIPVRLPRASGYSWRNWATTTCHAASPNLPALPEQPNVSADTHCAMPCLPTDLNNKKKEKKKKEQRH